MNFRSHWYFPAAVMAWVSLLPCVGSADVINATAEGFSLRFEAAVKAQLR